MRARSPGAAVFRLSLGVISCSAAGRKTLASAPACLCRRTMAQAKLPGVSPISTAFAARTTVSSSARWRVSSPTGACRLLIQQFLLPKLPGRLAALFQQHRFVQDGDLAGVEQERVVALCDVDWKHAAGTFKRYPDAKKYRDFRKMLEENEDKIDAVTVSTPDHTHALIAIWAARKGSAFSWCSCSSGCASRVFS